ncbi:inorganic diphosphatase [Theileria orientalis]|uniref:H(+)-exporting diphosphatase n=1 Tax=Theileria orientalis TaxID=68886 RepID=A0A976MDS3_THEOR|nr:inorganic diphosphatase [Theileria orientalis]
MGSADYTAIAVTSTFLGLCFIHVAKEFSFSLKIRDSTSPEDNFNSPGAVKQRLGKTINKLFLAHVGSNDLALLFILLAIAAIIWAVSGNLANALCFFLGSITSVAVGLIAIFVSRRTASKLVNLAHSGVRRVYKRCIGNASALVVLCLGLNALVILAISSALTLKEINNSNIMTGLKAISFYSFGNLVVTLYSRTSGGLYNNAFSILAQSYLENEDENRPIFDSMNTYLQNIYEVILEVVAIISTLFCTYFLVIGGFSDDGNIVATSFGYINFPVLVLAFSMAISVIFIFIFGFIMKNNSMKLIKRSFFYITGASLVVILTLLPIFHATFTPKTLETVRYGRFTNYGLVISGSVSGMLVAISNFWFLSSYTKPGKSVNLSVFTSLTGGVVNSLSFAKLLSVVPTLAVCFNLLMCVFGSDLYGLLYVAIGFMCMITMVLVGSVFYSLMVTSSKFARYCNYDNDVRHMLGSFKRSWYDINALVRPFISTMSILIALVLLSHLSHSLNLNKYSHFHPLVVMSTLIGCLFPVFQSGLILRISSGIANWRLKKNGYLGLLDELYFDHADDKDREDKDDRDMGDSFERNQKFLNKLKFWKKGGSDKKSNRKKSMSGHGKSSKDGTSPQESENGDRPQGDTEEVVVNVHGESNNFRTFGRAFKACLLKEAGVREDMLLNAPIMCSSARSTHQDYLTPTLAAQANLNQQNDLGVGSAAAEVVENTEAAIPQDPETNVTGSLGVYKHGSRDYRILKNADNHYKMFHPKYHDKHFNLRKKSKVASGSIEELQSLLSKDSEPVDETNETSIYCPSYELSDGVNSEIDCEPGDSLDKVYRRSEDMQKDVVRSVNIHYYNQTSCGSAYTERESGPILKVLQDNQVHTREPESDSESTNTKNNRKSVSQPSEASHSKRGSNEGRRRFGRSLRRSRGRKHPTEARSDEASVNKEPATAPASSPIDSSELPPPEEMDILARLSSFRAHSDIASDHDKPLSQHDSSIPKYVPEITTPAPSSDKETPAALSGTDTPLAPTGKNTPVSASGNESPRSQSSKLTDSGLGATDSSAPEPMGPSSSDAENDARPADSVPLDNDKDFAQELNIKIQQNLIPPDVDISNQPRRPTPKCIELPVFKDLEAASSDKVESTESSNLGSYSKTSSYHNTLISMLLSIVPFIFSLGFPMLFGVIFGSISVSVVALFSTVSSSLLVQVMLFCSTSWESTLLFMESKRARAENNGQDQVVNDIDFKNGKAINMIGKITLCSVGPVLNTLVIAIPLLRLIFFYVPFGRRGLMNRASQNVKFLEEGKAGELILKVNVKPGAKQTQVVGEVEGLLSLQISAPPREGECNKALVEYVAELLRLRKGNVSLIHGHKSRDKVLSLSGITLDEAKQLLSEHMDS